MPLHVSSTCAHHQEVKIALHSLWYHHTETSEWSKITQMTCFLMVRDYLLHVQSQSWRPKSAHGCHVLEYSRSYRPFLAIHNPRTVFGPPDPEKTNLGVVILSDRYRLPLVAANPSRVRADA